MPAGFNTVTKRKLKHYSRWTTYKVIASTTSAETVPENVEAIWVHVWGGGASNHSANNQNGAAGGYASGIVRVKPKILLPTLTVGAGGTGGAGGAGGTSSFGTLLTATGGLGITAGTGTVDASVTDSLTASGGAGSTNSSYGGTSPGNPYGNGLSATSSGGANASVDIDKIVINKRVPGCHTDYLLQFLNRNLARQYGALSGMSTIGLGGGSTGQVGQPFAGSGNNTATSSYGAGASASPSACSGGAGLIILVYSEYDNG